MNKDTMLAMFIISLLFFIFGFGFLLSSWQIREQMIYLQDWKHIYESGYCPTCGTKLESEDNNA